ncbi:hypothetical protein [Bifidobacterium cuniculi]|uniref:Membrane protein involved in colicin uptake n=1 Tax=Bifidobacterium cuniculi TaxID=1688 RepID=A0A087AQH2_9BIFI|nr:hypothetical protein [Bifidobacterium cuniculi]KFI61022.1 membrane protein involved in colicin uptake [Bifidobacterium cuniculi]
MNADSATDRRKRTRRTAAVIGSALLVAVLAAGGAVAVYQHSASAQLAEAKEACAQASETLRVARNKYDALHDQDAAEAVKITDKQVTDGDTVTTLADTYKEEAPALAACNVQGVDQLREAKERIDENAAWYDTHTADLSKAVDAVNASYDAKTLKDARDALSKQLTAAQEKVKSTDGKVKDDKTRKDLKAMIDKAAKTKDGEDVKAMNSQAKQLKDLMGKVDASVKAKTDADKKAAEEKARQEAEAAAAAQAQANAQAQQQYVAPQQSYTPTYTAPQQTYTAPATPQYTAPAAPQQSAPQTTTPSKPSTGSGGMIFNHSNNQGPLSPDSTDDGFNHNGF